jgi:predicted transglutaminase-like cysteine proteinase
VPTRLRTTLIAFVCLVSTAQAAPRLLSTEQAPPLPAWVTFCEQNANECAVDTNEPKKVSLSAATLELIEAVNRYVNHTIRPMTDRDHWGVEDRWDLPTDGYGDCEDYQLLKRKLLAEAGLPRRALRMTVVVDDATGQGHAVLTVRTSGDDLILDNQTDEVLNWQESGYTFVKRESSQSVGWVFLEAEASTAVVAMAQ